jgi:toxin secretion/phage lysis holin
MKPRNIGGELTMSALFTAVAAVFNKVPALLILFMLAVLVDYLTGWVKAAFFLHEWNSKTGLQGIIKKAMYFVLILTAFMVGYAIKDIGAQAGLDLGFSVYIGWYTLAVMLINELTSIIENLYIIMPDKVPTWLIKALKIADNKLDHKINDIVCKNQDCDECEIKERCNYYEEKQG